MCKDPAYLALWLGQISDIGFNNPWRGGEADAIIIN